MNHDTVMGMLEKKNKEKYFKYESERGLNTCEKCTQNDNKIFRHGDDNIPPLPLHPNCKCKFTDITNEQQIEKLDLLFNTQDNLKELKENKFNGFEADRFAELDSFIARIVAEFNANKSQWVGCSEEQAKKIPDMTASLLKSFFIQETGGNKNSWKRDPGQVNVPGDWDDEKSTLGLRRYENDLETNIRASLIALARKGFGSSFKPVHPRRPSAIFDGWEVALQRYNIGQGVTADGRPVSHEYARRIIDRAKNPQKHIPIEFTKIKK